MTPPVVVSAPAKVNLTLRVGAPTAATEPFHPLHTLFYRLTGLTDTLSVTPVEGAAPGAMTLSVSSPQADALDVPPGDNLVAKAWRVFTEAFGPLPVGCQVALTKRIPTQAGLGGGSADAAATLLALATLRETLTGHGVSRAELLTRCADALGSDVGFFLLGADLALGTGRGNTLRPLAPSLPVAVGLRWVVVRPSGMRSPTAAAYALFRETQAYTNLDTLRPPEPPTVLTADWLAEHAVNDFQRLLITHQPVWRDWFEAFSRQSLGSPPLLCGSGSCVIMWSHQLPEALTATLQACQASGLIDAFWLEDLQANASAHVGV